MTTPTLTVEIAFDSDPLTASPTWTDVTSYVRNSPGVRISRGRPTELDTFAAGQCSFTLDNRDARFSPLNSSSTYNGKLLPGKQVRITGSYGGTDYRLFRGFIVGWPQRYSQGKKDAIVPIVAYDALAKLNETDLADPTLTYIDTLVGSYSTVLRNYESKTLSDALGVRNANYQAGTVAAASSLAPGLSGDAISCTSGRLRIDAPTVGTSATYFFTSFWLETTSAGSSSTVWMAILSGVNADGYIIGIDNNGLLRYQAVDAGGGPTTARTQTRVNDGQPHHIVVMDWFGYPYIFVDGRDATDYATGLYNSLNSTGLAARYIGRDPGTSHLDFTGTLQDVIIHYDNGATAAIVARIYGIGSGTYRRTTATAIGEVLDAAGWPASLRSIATNTTGECVAQWTEGSSSLGVAQQIATTEQGRLFVSGSGNVTLLARYSHQLDTSATTVQATFSDDGADSDYVDVGFDYDDVRVRNSFTVSFPFGSASSEDATSVTAYGPQSGSVSTFLPDTNAAQDMADGLVFWRKDPQVRSLPLTATLDNTAQFANLLGLELGERVKFEITPPGMASQSAQELLLEQMDWDISNALWELTVQGSPVPPDVAFYDVDSYDDGCVYAF